MLSNIFDAHAHYDDGWFDEDRDSVLGNLPDKGVCGVVNNSVDLDNAQRVIALAEKYDYIALFRPQPDDVLCWSGSYDTADFHSLRDISWMIYLIDLACSKTDLVTI